MIQKYTGLELLRMDQDELIRHIFDLYKSSDIKENQLSETITILPNHVTPGMKK